MHLRNSNYMDSGRSSQ